MPSGAAKLAITLLLSADIRGFEGKMRKLDESMKGTIGRANAYGSKIQKAGMEMQKSGLANVAKGIAAMTPIAYVANQAVKLESAVADITKVLPETIKVGSDGFLKLEKSAQKVGYELGRSAEDTAGLMASLAAGGVAQKDLERTAQLAGQIGVAFDVTGLQAGQAFQAIRNAMQLDEKQVMQVMDANNALANNFGSTIDSSARLMQFMMDSGASVAASLKTSGADIQAFANSFMVIGVDSKVATTAIERFSKAILTNKDLAARFKAAGGGTKGIMSILQAARNSGDATKFLLERGVGSYSTQLAAVANAMNSDKGFKSQVKFVRGQGNVEGSVQEEFNNKAATTAFRLQQVKTGAENIAITLGETLIPIVRKLIFQITPFLRSISSWIERNPKLAGSILKVLAASAALKIGVGLLQFAFGGVLKAAGTVLKNGTRIIKVFKNVGKAFSAVTKLLMANPWALAIAAIAVGVYLIIKNWGAIKKFFSKLWVKIKEIFSVAWEGIKAIFFNATLPGLIIANWGKIKTFFSNLWNDVANIFKKAWDKIANSPIGKIIGKLVSGTSSLFRGVGNFFGGPGNNNPDPFRPTPIPQPIPIGGGSNDRFSFAPVFNVTGGMDNATSQKMTAQMRRDFERQMNDYQHNKNRKTY